MNVSESSQWEDAVRWLIAQPDRKDLILGGYYDQPRLLAAERFWQSPEWRAVRELLPNRPGRALDVGAGHGISSYALSKDGWETTALEPDPSELVGAGAIRSLAAEAGLSVRIVSEIAENLPFADNSFDVVYGRAVFHHARQLRRFCEELIRVLKPGGVLVATREHVISHRGQLQKFLKHHPLHHLYGGENAYLLSEYLDAITAAGARMVKVLRPLDSPINYAPHDREGLRIELAARASRYAGALPAWLLKHDQLYEICLRLLALVDRRPG